MGMTDVVKKDKEIGGKLCHEEMEEDQTDLVL
jgi:hypothetical protein